MTNCKVQHTPSPCECSLAGWCSRHSMFKNQHWVNLCQKNEEYRREWDRNQGPGQNRKEKFKARAERKKRVQERTARYTRLREWIKVYSSPEDRGIGDTILRLVDQTKNKPDLHILLLETLRECSCSRKIAKDILNTRYPYPKLYQYPPRSLDPMIRAVTSVSPLIKHRESQTRAFDSWKKHGLSIVAVNTSNEICSLATTYPQIDTWIQRDNEVSWAGRKTQRVYNLFEIALLIQSKILVINSDIEIFGPQQILIDNLPQELPTLGIRWNYRNSYSDAKEFEWGFDVVGVTPDHVLKLPKDLPFGIGQPVWDYAVPMLLSTKHTIIHEPLFYHKEHPLNWNDQAWAEGAKHFSKWFGEINQSNSYKFRKAFEPEMKYDTKEGRYVYSTNS